MSVNETVSDRIELAHSELTPMQIVAGVVFGAAIVFTLLFLQEPLAHDATHNFRHAAGIVCHWGMIHEYFQRGVAAGFVAGLAYGLYMAFVGHPLSEYVANVASGHVHEGTEAHDHATQVIPETTTVFVSVGSGLLWAVFLGGVFSVTLYFLEPALPGGDRAKAYILASAGFFSISIVPWIAFPPAVPGAELSYDISSRITLYLGLVIIGLGISAIAIRTYNRFSSHHISIRVFAGISPILITAIILQITAPTVVIQPNLSDDLITAYQGLVVFSQAALWFLIATAFTQLQQRSGQSRTTESTEKPIASS